MQGSGFRVQGSGFRVQGSGCGVQGSGFRVWCVEGWKGALLDFEEELRAVREVREDEVGLRRRDVNPCVEVCQVRHLYARVVGSE